MPKFPAMLLAATCFATPAGATVVYNNGAPSPPSGNETTGWVQAEDFNFAAATDLRGAGVYLAGLDGIGAWDGSFSYYLFANSAGAPGVLLTSGNVSPTVSDTGLPWCCGGNHHLFAFDFGSTFAAAAGTTYWLGIHASSNFDQDNLYWVSTLPNATGTGHESPGGTFDNWANNSGQHAFYLTAIPEVETWAMMLLGFGATGIAIRRSRRGGLVARRF